MLHDARGLPLSTDSPEVVTLFDETVTRYLEYRLSTMETLKALLAIDGEFVMGRCLQGYLYSLLATNRMQARIEAALHAAEAHIGNVTTREALHVQALRAWSQGDLESANRHWESIIAADPCDVLALRLLHFNAFWMGRTFLLRDVSARVMPAWQESMPGYGSVLGMYSFGLEECGDYASAERFGRRAVELNKDDLWAIHAVAHTLEMQGRLREGSEWLDYPHDAWDDRNPFKGHLWWHRALFALEAGRYDEVVDLYDNSVRPEPSEFYLDIQNATSLLMRLQLAGIDIGSRWRELAEYAHTHIDDHVLVFNEMHSMLALAAESHESAGKLIDSLREFAKTPDNYAASVTVSTVIPLCEAVMAYHQGDYNKVVDLLEPLRYRLEGVGGSHAQRDIFVQLLIEAALRSGNTVYGAALLRERVTNKPNSVITWEKYAKSLEAADDADGAAAARAQARSVASAYSQ
jgi:tetratricopeptide (TPR) repeat protein